MKIVQMFSTGKPVFSFEFFPPSDDTAAAALMDVVAHLQTLNPDFVTVTYGAGGSTRARTLDLVARIKKELHIETMAHLTCVGHSKAEISAIIEDLSARGIENILALRGDPPKGEKAFKPHPDGFHHANELVAAIESLGRFCIGVAGYPEKHPEAPTIESDLTHLKQKVDAGGSFITTQLFFHNELYFDFVARCRAIGISCPILPGIMPITNWKQIQRIATLCGASIPRTLVQEMGQVQDNQEAVTRLGINYAAQQCRELLQRGAPGIHFYTLNKSRATREILEHLRSLRNGSGPSLLGDV
jgi:methylenetetrahydrofolate reductase (NADPH)